MCSRDIWIQSFDHVTFSQRNNVFIVKYESTAQKLKFSVKDFFSKFDQIRSFLRIWSHLLKQFWTENFHFFCAVVSLAALNSFRNLKSETHLLNDQVSKASSVNNGLAKTCLVADMLRNNLSRIFYHWLQVALLRFGVSARFGSFWIAANIITA